MTAERADFPVLAREIDGVPITYLDSAATSLKPRQVLDAARTYNEAISANVHRGRHALSTEASVAYEGARRAVARFVNADPDCVVFTRNATESLNLIARGLDLAPTDRIAASLTSHNSNVLPWLQVGQVHFLDSERRALDAPIDVDRLEHELSQIQPRVLALCHASNVTGVIQPIEDICAVARRLGIITVIDAAQSAPHVPIDVDAIGADFVAFSAHKMLGTTGLGVLYGRYERLQALTPLVIGGGAVTEVTTGGFVRKPPPHCFEAGTPNISGALALEAAIDYLDAIGWDALRRHEESLADLLDRELAALPGCQRLMSQARPRLAIASIVPTGERIGADHLAQALSDTHKVMVRSGTHCCQLLFDALGMPAGAVRASAYVYNDADDIRRLGRGLRDILDRYHASPMR